MIVEWTLSDDIGHVDSLDTPHSNEFCKKIIHKEKPQN